MEKIKQALMDATNWIMMATPDEKRTVTIREAKEKVIERIIQKYDYFVDGPKGIKKFEITQIKQRVLFLGVVNINNMTVALIKDSDKELNYIDNTEIVKNLENYLSGLEMSFFTINGNIQTIIH